MSALCYLLPGILYMIDRIIALLILCLVLSIPAGMILLFTGDVLLNFVFFYPLFMSGIWITGGVYFWLRRERHWPWGDDVPPPELKGNPLVSILIPCFNEGLNARETIHAALAQTYTNIEVIAINDGSSDDTAQVLDSLLAEDPRLRVIHLAHNQGKAIALRMGAAAARRPRRAAGPGPRRHSSPLASSSSKRRRGPPGRSP